MAAPASAEVAWVPSGPPKGCPPAVLDVVGPAPPRRNPADAEATAIWGREMLAWYHRAKRLMHLPQRQQQERQRQAMCRERKKSKLAAVAAAAPASAPAAVTAPVSVPAVSSTDTPSPPGVVASSELAPTPPLTTNAVTVNVGVAVPTIPLAGLVTNAPVYSPPPSVSLDPSLPDPIDIELMELLDDVFPL